MPCKPARNSFTRSAQILRLIRLAANDAIRAKLIFSRGLAAASISFHGSNFLMLLVKSQQELSIAADAIHAGLSLIGVCTITIISIGLWFL